jgi:alpha-tubulin suppressor-like RCC1 family protein
MQVSGISGVAAVAAGQKDTVALKIDGTVWTWGYNSNGQLGNNSTTDSHIPVQAL